MNETKKISHLGREKESQRPALTKEQMFTGGKTPELAIFYNIAFFRMAGYLNFLLGNDYETDKDSLEKVVKIWKSKVSDNADTLKTADYSKLRNYLWKAYMLDKNTAGFILEESEIQMIREMIFKLYHIRNFQSHIWHDNQALVCSRELSFFIEELHENAIMAQTMDSKLNKEVDKYINNYSDIRKNKNGQRNNIKLFDIHDNKYYLKQDGRVFFLSMFLNRGEMNQLMQLSKGFKRNDIPEYKIKRRIFQYYTHRDGASRNYYGFEENILESLPQDQQEETLAARQTFKILSNLNDIPSESSNPHLFPLFLVNGYPVEKATQMIQWCVENSFLPDLQKNLIIKAKGDEDSLTLEGYLELKLENSNNIAIKISVYAFHQLILDSIREKDNGRHIMEMLNVFINERQWIKNFLSDIPHFRDKTDEEQIEDRKKLDEYQLFKLRSNDYLKEKLTNWLDRFDKGALSITDDKLLALTVALEQSYIELNYHAFFFEQERKPRAMDRFMEFSAQYLMDFNKTPQWEWMFEAFETKEQQKEVWDYGVNKKVVKKVNTRNLIFSTTKPKKCRLVINEQHLTFRHQSYPEQLFAVGYRAMKNIMVAVMENKSIEHLPVRLLSDIQKLNKNEALQDLNELSYLTINEIPHFMLKTQKHNIPLDKVRKELIEKATKRIDYIISQLPSKNETELSETEKKQPYRNRVDKNRQIMRCYLYYDWKYENNSKFKFLRKNEYQRMSVYHYSLNDINKKKMNDKNNRYAFLLTDIASHMPDEIKTMIESSSDLDDLLNIVSINTIEKLTNWKTSLPFTKGKSFIEILTKLGVSNLGQSHNSNKHIPFDIHPIIPLRMFFNTEGDISKISLSKRTRESVWASELYQAHYNYTNYLSTLNQENAILKKKIIGEINNILSKDTILWFMAKNYMNRMNPAIRDLVINNGIGNQQWQLGNLRQMKIPFPMHIDTLGIVYVELKFHQLDDYLLIESKHMMKRIVKQLFYRYQNPVAEEHVGVILQDGIYTVQYDEINREMQRVYQQSRLWVMHLLEWERKELEKIGAEEKDRLEKKEQGFNHINFGQILAKGSLTDELKVKLRALRNTAFHANIPGDWSYEQLEKDQEICELLKFIKIEPKNYQLN